ncbi:MAG: DUF6744 family protein [Candidatus Methanomethylicaceae archaeon]
MIQTIQQLQEVVKVSRQLPTLGTLSWWSIQEARIPVDAFTSAAKSCGIPDDWLLEPPSAEHAFTQAAKYAARMLFQRKQVSTVKTLDDDKQVIIAITAQLVRGDGSDPQLDVLAHAVLDRQNLQVSIDGPVDQEKFKSIFDYFLSHYTSQDVRDFLLRVIRGRLMALCIRPNGGIYFTQRQFDPDIEKLERLISLLPGRSVFLTLGVVDSAKARTNMWQIFQEEMIMTLDKLADEIRTMIASGHACRKRSLAARIARLQRELVKTESYEQLLEINAQELRDRIAALRGQVEQALASISEAKEEHDHEEGLLGIAA